VNPLKFVSKPTFAFVCIVYGSTYVAANTITSFFEMRKKDSFYPRLFGTTVVNMSLGIAKDRYFAKVFSKNAAPVFPLVSWGLFVLRDLLTIGAGFNFPSVASTYLQDAKIISSKEDADKVAQLSVPMAAQLVLTPIHLLALDIYNRAGQTAPNRISYISNVLPGALSIRLGRVLCAYSIAGVSNKSIKQALRDRFL
jgi:hypothetical protein